MRVLVAHVRRVFCASVLQGVDLAVVRARFALIKYMNRLVTPLLYYVDVSSYEAESALKSDELVAVDVSLANLMFIFNTCHRLWLTA